MNVKIAAMAQCNPVHITQLVEQFSATDNQILDVASLKQLRPTAANGDQVMLFYTTPFQAIVTAMVGGASPESGLDSWRNEINAILDFYRQHRRITTLIEESSALANPSLFAELIRDRLALNVDIKTTKTADKHEVDIWYQLIACQLINQSVETNALLIQLEAASLPTAPDLFALPKLLPNDYFNALNKTKQQKTDAEAEITALTQQLAQERKNATLISEKTQSHIDSLDTELASEKQKCSHASKTFKEMEAANSLIIEHLHKAQEELEQQLIQKAEADKTIADLSQELKSLQKRQQQTEADRANAELVQNNQKQSANAEIKQLKDQLLTLNNNLNGEKQKLSQAQQANREIETENSQIIEHLHKAQEELEQQLILKAEADKTIAGLSQELKSLQKRQQQTEAARAKAELEQNNLKQAANAEIKQLKDQLQTLNNNLNGEKQKLSQAQQASCEIETENSQIIEYLHKAQEDLEQYILNNRALSDENRTLSHTLKTTATDLYITQRQLEKKQDQLDTLRNSVTWKVMAPARVLGSPFKRLSADEKSVKKQILLVAGSQQFVAEWYIKTYPDVLASGIDPAEHYVRFGGFEDRDPGPDFSTSSYLRHNPDVREAGMNPLVHYIKFGADEARQAK